MNCGMSFSLPPHAKAPPIRTHIYLAFNAINFPFLRVCYLVKLRSINFAQFEDELHWPRGESMTKNINNKTINIVLERNP